MDLFRSLSRFERRLWMLSVTVVTLSFFCSGGKSFFSLCDSLIGVTALIFLAKGKVTGQVLTVVFSLGYAIISYQSNYYGEMITYLGMTMPIAMMSVVSWLRHPYQGEEKEVEIAKLNKEICIVMVISTILVTWIFYYILKYFHTANLEISTLSIATSYLASFLMFFRNPAYALAYSANDIVLIVLWILASIENIANLPMICCFAMFLLNDLYGYYNWKRMHQRQNTDELCENGEKIYG